MGVRKTADYGVAHIPIFLSCVGVRRKPVPLRVTPGVRSMNPMNRSFAFLAALAVSATSLAQMPWPMERHDRWGSGTATMGPPAASFTSPWVLARLSTTGLVSHGPALVSSTVGYYGDWINNKVYKFNPSTGAIYSSFQASHFVQSSPAVGPNGEVYAYVPGSNPPGRLIAINPSTMDYDWFVDTNTQGVDDFHAASATVGPDGDVVVPSTTGTVYKVDQNGFVVWSRPGLQSAYRTIVFSRDDTKVYVSNGTAMTALNYSDGTIAWSNDYGSNVGSPGVAPTGKLFFGTVTGNIYKVDAATGATLWTKPVLGEVHYAPAFSSSGATIYFVDNSGRLYSFRHSDGLKQWSYSINSQSITNAPIVGRDGRIYIYDRVGDLASVSAAGQKIWQLVMPDNAYGRGTMSIGADGTLYVGYVSDSASDSGMAIIRQQPQLHTASTLIENVGTSVSGTRTDTYYSDNHYLIGAPSPSDLTPKVQYTITRSVPTSGQAQLWIWLESSATTTGITQTVELWDNVASAWSQIDQQVIGTTDKTSYLQAPADITRFVNPSTGVVQARVTYTGSGTTWQAKIDKLAIGNVPNFGW